MRQIHTDQPTSPRPLTAYAAPFLNPFASSLHLSVRETPRSRASFHDTPMALPSIDLSQSKEESRFKRKFEVVASGVTKVAKSFKIGLSRPLRSDTVQPGASSNAAATATATPEKRWSELGGEGPLVTKKPSQGHGLKRTMTGHRRTRGSRSSNSRASLERMRPETSVGDSAVEFVEKPRTRAGSVRTRRPTPILTVTGQQVLEDHAFRIQNSATTVLSSREVRPTNSDFAGEPTIASSTQERPSRLSSIGNSRQERVNSIVSVTTATTSPNATANASRSSSPTPSPPTSYSSSSSEMQRQRTRPVTNGPSSAGRSLLETQISYNTSSPTTPSSSVLSLATSETYPSFQTLPPPFDSRLHSFSSFPSLHFAASAGAGARAAVHNHNLSRTTYHHVGNFAALHSATQLPPPRKSFAQAPTHIMLPSTVFACKWCEQAGKASTMCVLQSCPTLAAYQSRRRDPSRVLPIELMMLALGHLDIADLSTASRVSRAWREVAIANTVWRDVYRSRYLPSEFRSHRSYMQVGGMGMGLDDKSPRDWIAMAKARLAVEQNWKNQDPSAIYFNGHTDSVYCCQFDENKIITGSRDRTIRVWDMISYRCIKVIGGPQYRPALPSPNAPQLERHKSCVVNVESVNGTAEGNAIYHVPEFFHDASVLCLQFDDKILVTGSSDYSCIVWDINTFEPKKRLRFHKGGVLDICFDEKYIVSCSKDQKIAIWSRETLELVHVLDEHLGPVNAIQLRGDTLLSGAGDGRAILWCLKEFRALKVFDTRDRGLAAVELTEDGRYALVGGNEYVVRKYSTKSCKSQFDFSGHLGLVRTLHADCTNRRIVTGSYDQSVRVWDMDGESMGNYANWTTSWILSIKADYRRVVATSQDGRVLLMDFGYNIPNVDLLQNSKSSHGYWDNNGYAKGHSKHVPLSLRI